jgi:hypothetical protein
MTEYRIPNKVLNIKQKAKCTAGRSKSGWEQWTRKDMTQRKGE